ncbi:type II secretion system F family protein [soil metagenome]
MATFLYVAKDKKGDKVEGSMEAEGRPAVVTRLQQMGYFPMQVSQAARKDGKIVAIGGASSAAISAQAGGKGSKKEVDAKAAKANAPAGMTSGGFFEKKIKTADISNFNRQLADLIGAGIPLVKALGILVKQTPNEKLREVITGILDEVQAGATFAESLAKNPRVFSKLYVAMVRSGEAGGMLDEVLSRLADFSEQEEQLKGKIRSALAYPVVMILAGSVAVGVMFVYVIPKITATFDQLGQTLPAITQVLIMISRLVQNYWWAVIVAGIFAGTAFYQFTHSTDGKAMWHRLQLRLPIIGPLVQKREVARFARTLGSLLRNGVSILAALDIVREVVDNTVVRKEVDRVVEEITQGASIADPLRNSQVFPPVAVNMIAIGEETGRLPEVLLRVSETFEIQVERATRTMTSLIEPLIIVVMGCVVGFIVISMLLPIFSLDPSGHTR